MMRFNEVRLFLVFPLWPRRERAAALLQFCIKGDTSVGARGDQNKGFGRFRFWLQGRSHLQGWCASGR